MKGKNQALCAKCSRPSCIHPSVCRNLDNSHRPLIDLYRKVSAVKGIKKAFIGSGIRYDLFEQDGGAYLREVIRNHVSGRLKVAPEHTEEHVLKLMRKPPFDRFRELNAQFKRICSEEGLNYQLIPYFISSHPGCTETDMRHLADETRRLHFLARTGAGPDPDADDPLFGHVLHRREPVHGRKGLRGRTKEKNGGRKATSSAGKNGRNFIPLPPNEEDYGQTIYPQGKQRPCGGSAHIRPYGRRAAAGRSSSKRRCSAH